MIYIFSRIWNSQNFLGRYWLRQKITPKNTLIGDSSNECCRSDAEPKLTPISVRTARKITPFCEVHSIKESGWKIFYFLQRLAHPNFWRCYRACSDKINTLNQSCVAPWIRSQPPWFFLLETRCINNFLWKKFWAALSKITPICSIFQKKSAIQKSRFSPVGRNFDDRFLKKAPKTSIFEVPALEVLFLTNFRWKHSDTPKFSFRTLPIDILRRTSKKSILALPICQTSATI